jgi:hypothetical protein
MAAGSAPGSETPPPDEEENPGDGGSTIKIPEHIEVTGGGCNSGLTASAFALASLYCLRKRR